MRLTLRTMLAYMDDILEPEDAQDLGKKIEESETASKLVARTRDVMRRLRLGAPNVGERGAMLDPNTVAEYLDNTLHGDRVPDFEKVCLESDVHLAEVASCHQILTLVLGEPAEVDPASRQQMYQLPNLVAAQAKAAKEAPAQGTGGGGDGPAAAEKTTSPSRPTVPDYLREPPKKRRFWPVAAALFLAGFFTVVILAAVGQFDPGTPLGNLLGIRGGDGDVAQAPDQTETPAEPAGDQPQPPEKLQQPEGAKPKAPDAKIEGPEPPAEKAPLPEDVKPAPKEQPGVKPAGPGATPESTPPIKPGPPLEHPEAKPKPEPGPAKPDTVDTVVKPGEAKPGTAKPGVAVAESPQAKPGEPAPVPEEVLGRLVSEHAVLARFEPKGSEWQRVPAQGSVSANKPLLALPAYRPMITLTAGVTLQMMGGTQIELLPADDAGVTGLSIVYGQVVMQTVGKAGTQLRIQAGNLAGVLTFADPESKVAIAVSRTHVPAADPETQPDPVKAELFATSGRIAWTPSGGGPPVIVESIGLLTLDGQPAQATPLEKLPEWVRSDTSSPLDRRASAMMEPALTGDRPLRVGLKEMADHRQKEVRSLAVRCLGYLGDFQMVVAALNNADERLLWPDHVGHLQETLLRGPQAAAAVRRAIEEQFGQEGPVLFRMLCGYTDEGLEAGDAAKLVGHLEHNDLAFRVLSFWNLKNITGWGLNYRPEDLEAKRKRFAQEWRRRLESGAIKRRKKEAEPAKPAPAGPPASKTPSIEGKPG